MWLLMLSSKSKQEQISPKRVRRVPVSFLIDPQTLRSPPTSNLSLKVPVRQLEGPVRTLQDRKDAARVVDHTVDG